MKSRLSSTVWLLVVANLFALFGVLGLAYSAGKQRAGCRRGICSRRPRGQQKCHDRSDGDHDSRYDKLRLAREEGIILHLESGGRNGGQHK